MRFLLGDSAGAIVDLDKAQKFNPNDHAILNLRSLIENGDVDHVSRTASQSFDPDLLDNAAELIKEGKGEDAFEIFVNLEENGYNKAFSFMNKAICCLLETDSSGAKEYLSKLKVNVGTPMSVNIMIARYIVAVLDGDDLVYPMNELNIILSAVPHYNIEISPVKNLIIGLKRRNPTLYKMVFKELSRISQLSMRNLR